MQCVDDMTEQLDKGNVKFIQNACVNFSNAFDHLQPAIVLKKMASLGFSAATDLVGVAVLNTSQWSYESLKILNAEKPW